MFPLLTEESYGNQAMVDKSKNRKKGFITDEDASALLERYSANQVLALLQEISQVAGEKIDWHEIVKNTATGISDARECQIMWRHLAYGQTLPDQIDPDQNLMDDDSDLEYEMEAFPPVGREATSEAAACVKVLIDSGHKNVFGLSNSSTIEAPLTISMPDSKPVTIPVTLKRVLSLGTLGERRPTNEATRVNVPPKRKRGWSTNEDLKLTAAANKNVEPNWADISRVEFKDDRNATELSKRWENLKKKPEQLAAAHRAMSMALDRPKNDNFKSASGGWTSQQPKKPFAPPPDQPLGRGGPLKPQASTERPSMDPVKAAGACTASSAVASSLLGSQNVTTEGGGSSLMRPVTTSQLPRNEHFIRNGLAKAPISTYFAAKAVVQPNPAAPTPVQKGVYNAVAKDVIKYDQVASPTDLSGSTPVENNGHAENDRVVLPSSEAADNGKNAVTRNSQAM